ncbi:hypothetical protein [Muricoccus radiodurans]|uniref:hypothetical protein n=1 Tax=Muricoccus radiodurans TaxID=2231721 RepID=UPI003CF23F76
MTATPTRTHSARPGGGVMLAALGLAGMLAGCAPPRGGAAPMVLDRTAAAPAASSEDGCGPQVRVFVSAGDLLGAPPRPAGGPAELAAELARENAALDRLQAAFDALVYCRWTEVRLVRDAASFGRLAQPTARARVAQTTARLRADLVRANEFRDRAAGRAAALDAAAGRAPGGRTAVAPRVVLTATATEAVPLRAGPDGSSREVGRIAPRSEVQVAAAPNGFALVQAGALRGFARAESLTRLPTPATGPEELRILAASNVARREIFAETVALAQRAAETGFDTSL